MTASATALPAQTVVQPLPPSDETATEQLRRALVEKIREIPATELDTIREYIKIIKELGEEERG